MRIRQASVLLVIFSLLILACGGSSTSGAATSAPEPPAAAPAATTTTTTTLVTTTSTSTTQPTTTTLKTEIAVDGDQDFVEHTGKALALLQDKAPDAYGQVFEHIDTIRSVSRGSAMLVETKTFNVGNETAYAPDTKTADQLIWYAGAMVHDSCHSRQNAAGGTYTGKEAEIECLGDQLSALELIEPRRYYVEYVQGLIDGADDPENQYWNDPNRHW